jgi:Ca-activated chloride channel family protein
VDVIVTDPRGTIIKGLRPQDFELLDEGKPQEIAHFSQDEIPLAIALVVDVSGSMSEIIGPLRKALAASLRTLKQEDLVALISFHGTAKVEIGFSRDFEAITHKIGKLRSSGGTNINEAIYDSARLLQEEAPRARRVIILVSDMVGSYHGGKPAMQQLIESEATLFCIRVPSGFQPNVAAYQAIVDELKALGIIEDLTLPATPAEVWATASGGVVLNVFRKEGMQIAVEHLIQMLRTRYTLGFYPNPPGKPASIRQLKVQPNNDQIKSILPGTIVTFRNRYRVPPEK